MLTCLVTVGDPAGIGIEVCLKMLVGMHKTSENHKREQSFLQARKRITQLIAQQKIVLRLIGSKTIFKQRLKAHGLKFIFTKNDAVVIDDKCVCYFHDVDFLLSTKKESLFSLPVGTASAMSGEVAYRSLAESVSLAKKLLADGSRAAIVTAPVSKQAINIFYQKKSLLFAKKFIGHTEYFQQAFGCKNVSMTFLSPAFNLVLVTTHLPIKSVAKAITPKSIRRAVLHAIEIQKRTGDTLPILLLGLNPHAGEGGILGKEEAILYRQAELFRAQGVSITSPLPADALFYEVQRGKYQTVIACYHDQGLIPLKMLARHSAVNATLSLPVVRTSVAHGTAYDLAKKDLSKKCSDGDNKHYVLAEVAEDSLWQALDCAYKLASPY